MNNDSKVKFRDSAEQVRTPLIIAIGGGKGGIGKTVMTASMGVGLASLKREVINVDADLGGANLHTVMGIEKPAKTLHNFLNKECKDLNEIVIEYPPLENLKVICGASGSMGAVSLPFFQKLKLIRHLKKIDTDFIILDLGAGTSYNVLDLFLTADIRIVLINPDPLSILEGYNFIKQVFYRGLIKEFKQYNGPLEIIKRQASEETFKSTMTVEDLLEKVTGLDNKVGKEMEVFLERFHIKLLMNMMQDPNDETNGLAVKVAAQDLLSLNIEYIGAVHKDDTVRRSLENMVPFISFDPKSQASRDLAEIIISKILHAGKFQSLQDKRSIRNIQEKWDPNRSQVICSIKCIYWEECEYKNGGYPCKLQHLVQMRGFHKE